MNEDQHKQTTLSKAHMAERDYRAAQKALADHHALTAQLQIKEAETERKFEQLMERVAEEHGLGGRGISPSEHGTLLADIDLGVVHSDFKEAAAQFEFPAPDTDLNTSTDFIIDDPTLGDHTPGCPALATSSRADCNCWISEKAPPPYIGDDIARWRRELAEQNTKPHPRDE